MADDAGTFAPPYQVRASMSWSQPVRGPDWTNAAMDSLLLSLGRGEELAPHSLVPAMNPRDIFRAYRPPEGFGRPIDGPDASGMAMDDAIKLAEDWDNTIGAQALSVGGSALAQGIGFLGYPFLAELSQRPEYRMISETIAEELTRKWIRVTSTSKGKDKTGKVDAMNEALDRFKLRERFHKSAELDGFMGRCQLFVDMGTSPADNAELNTPLMLTPEKIGKGSLKGFRVVEPMWSYPLDYNSTDPLTENFYVPTSWAVMQRRVHASRLHTFIGRPMPDLLKPAYAFGGLSLSQMAMPYVQNWLRTRQSVSDLVHSFSVMILATDMGSTLDSEGMNKLLRRAQAAVLFRDNRGMQIINKATEEFTNVAAPISGLHELQAQSQEQMASISRIPLVKLLGVTPSGLNASSDGEIRVFYDRVKATQEKFMGPHLKHALDVIQLSEFGEVDDDLTHEWVPLWELDAAGAAAVRKTDADTGAVLIESGTLDPKEERQRIANATDSPYQGLDVDDMPEPPDMGESEEGEPDIPGAQPRASGNPAKSAEPASVERAGDAAFVESDHPRDDDGTFTDGAGGERDAAKARHDKDEDRLELGAAQVDRNTVARRRGDQGCDRLPGGLPSRPAREGTSAAALRLGGLVLREARIVVGERRSDARNLAGEDRPFEVVHPILRRRPMRTVAPIGGFLFLSHRYDISRLAPSFNLHRPRQIAQRGHALAAGDLTNGQPVADEVDDFRVARHVVGAADGINPRCHVGLQPQRDLDSLHGPRRAPHALRRAGRGELLIQLGRVGLGGHSAALASAMVPWLALAAWALSARL